MGKRGEGKRGVCGKQERYRHVKMWKEMDTCRAASSFHPKAVSQPHSPPNRSYKDQQDQQPQTPRLRHRNSRSPFHTPTADLFPTRGNHPVSRFPETRAEARIYHANIHETKYKGVSASMSRILRVYGCRCRLLYIACCSLCYGCRQRAGSVCRESRGMEGR